MLVSTGSGGKTRLKDSLGFFAGANLLWQSAHKLEIQFQLGENGFEGAEARNLTPKFHIDNIMVGIDFISQSRDHIQLQSQAQHLVRRAHPGGINFKFDHVPIFN